MKDCCYKKDLHYIKLTNDIWEKAKYNYDITNDLYVEATSKTSNYYVTNSNIRVQHVYKLFNIMSYNHFINEAELDDYLVFDDNLRFIDILSEKEFNEFYKEI